MEALARCRYKHGRLLGRVSGLGKDLELEARSEILSSEVHETSSIEGIELDWENVRSSVARRLGLQQGGARKEDAYTEGIIQVMLDATENFEEPLTIDRLHGWHSVLFPTGRSGMTRIPVGEFRSEDPMRVLSGPIGRERIHYEAPPSNRLSSEMNRFLEWWKASRGRTEGLLRAGIAGFYFVTLHPYADGNGRLSRAITEMALCQDENRRVRFYSLSSQIRIERDDYYAILESSQKGTCDLTEWLLWFLGCVERAVDLSERQIGVVLLKSGFWKRHRQSGLSEKQIKVVDRLLEAGPKGFEGDLTTRKYVGLTKVSRATAYRDIQDLVDRGILVRAPEGGRSTRYRLSWPLDKENEWVFE